MFRVSGLRFEGCRWDANVPEEAQANAIEGKPGGARGGCGLGYGSGAGTAQMVMRTPPTCKGCDAWSVGFRGSQVGLKGYAVRERGCRV